MSPILKVANREWQRILSTRQLWIMTLVLPIVFALVIILVYETHYLPDVPTVVVDMDHTTSSHKLARLLDQHRYLKVIDHISSLQVAQTYLQERKAYAVIVIPVHFEKDVKSGRQATFKAISYGTNLVIGREIQKSVTETILTMNAGISITKKALRTGSRVHSIKYYPPIKEDIISLYNPYYNYQSFVPPGMILAAWQILFALVIATSFAKELEEKSWHSSIQLAANSKVLLVIGKLIPFLLLSLANWLMLTLLLFPLFHIPFQGSYLMGTCSYLLFTVTVYLFSSGAALLFKDILLSSAACSLTLAGAFAFSGYTYPFWEIPLIPRLFAMIMPTTHYLPLFIQYYMQGSHGIATALRWQHFLIYSFILSIAHIVILTTVNKEKTI